MENLPCPRDKLGLALAGGGFRATLFHIGVLRRLAEHDLLRRVEVLSTVSGGSVTGVAYALLLKKYLDQHGTLSQDQYRQLVEELEQVLRGLMRKNLRTRLFLNPCRTLKTLLTPWTLGESMAELYDRHLIEELKKSIPDLADRNGPVRLSDLKIKPACKSIESGIETYNRQQVEKGDSPITKLVINSTSLNSGSRFWFTASELGEWIYGAFRHDEIKKLLSLKERIKCSAKEPHQRPQDLEEWWQATGCRIEAEQSLTVFNTWPLPENHQWPDEYRRLQSAWLKHWDFEERNDVGLYALCTAEMGRLRFLRDACRRLSLYEQELTKPEKLQLESRLVYHLAFICQADPTDVNDWFHNLDKDACDHLRELINNLYILRLAVRIDGEHARDGIAKLPLHRALAASANFPPVFPPLPLRHVYDRKVVRRLGLTDGGVFDNLGIQGLLDENCNYIIASDSGHAFSLRPKASQGRFGMITRIASVLGEVGLARLRDQLLEQHAVSRGLTLLQDDDPDAPTNEILQRLHRVREMHGVTVFRINAAGVLHREAVEDAHKGYTANDVANIRTDLDVFSDIETRVLINQGFDNAGLYLKRWFGFRIRDCDDKTKVPAHLCKRYGNQPGCPYPYERTAEGDWKKPALPSPKPKDRVTRTLRVANILLLRAVFYRLAGSSKSPAKWMKAIVYSLAIVILLGLTMAGATWVWSWVAPDSWPWYAIAGGMVVSILYWWLSGVVFVERLGKWPSSYAWVLLVILSLLGLIMLALLALLLPGIDSVEAGLCLSAVILLGFPVLLALLLWLVAGIEYCGGQRLLQWQRSDHG